jgi:thiol-disulfide isomerase/thioredoxin
MLAYPDSKNAFGQPPTYPVDILLKKLELADAVAPEITVDNKIGNFQSLKAWKGKVVIVDFFAHWCGPCIRSFPTLRQYLADYGDKGLEVVGVTSYYSYYGAVKNVAKADELASVKNKFLPEHKMSWPVVFDAKQATQAAYGVQGIPHLVIVDRKGKIRKVEVGFNPAHEAEIRKLIEACLAEK